ncbi:MAG: sugar ABC transporter permease [Spirochaetales bacterium]|nr:sugar ABC transporter permease [Spirochaetales bacterium]
MSEVNQLKEKKTSTFKDVVKSNMRNYSIYIMLGVILFGFAIPTHGVNLSPRNITNLFIQNSYILILAVGMVMVIVIGNIDLSVGSVTAFAGAIGAILYNAGIGLFATILLTIIVGMIIGAFQGYWIAYVRIPAFIVTLAGMNLFRGLTYILTNVTPITPHDDTFKQVAIGCVSPEFLRITHMVQKGAKTVEKDFHLLPLIVGVIAVLLIIYIGFRGRNKKKKYGFHMLPVGFFILKMFVLSAIIMLLSIQFARYRGIPIVFIILLLAVAIYTFITKNTVFGRYIYAVGGNAKSAKLSGINSENVEFLVHIIMGAFCGLAGIIFTAYMNSALPDAGNLFELEAIASTFIGGASASGGIGTIIGAIMGGLILGIIKNGMSLQNIGANWQYVVKALVLLLAVWYDIYTRKKSGTI